MTTLTLFQATDGSGTLMHGVSYQGMPLMASTPDKDRAWQVLESNRVKLSRNGREVVVLMHWDGDRAIEQPLADFVAGSPLATEEGR